MPSCPLACGGCTAVNKMSSMQLGKAQKRMVLFCLFVCNWLMIFLLLLALCFMALLLLTITSAQCPALTQLLLQGLQQNAHSSSPEWRCPSAAMEEMDGIKLTEQDPWPDFQKAAQMLSVVPLGLIFLPCWAPSSSSCSCWAQEHSDHLPLKHAQEWGRLQLCCWSPSFEGLGAAYGLQMGSFEFFRSLLQT